MWLVGWLAAWLAGWLAGWLVGWLVGGEVAFNIRDGDSSTVKSHKQHN